uniref:Uncharacterized protein n=1 Tax=Panagrolaimus sp. JU765 TaxID=591449 RepID=A0AC34RT19_9BILA
MFVIYLKNMIVVADRCSTLAQELWVIVIEKLLQIDAIISRSTRDATNRYVSDETSLFVMEEDDIRIDETKKQLEVELTDKLDKCMTLILARISKNRKKIKGECTKDAVQWIKNLDFDDNLDSLFEQFWPAFVETTLQAHDVQSVPFIWFYFCSFEEKYLNFMLRILWNLVAMPSFAPNEWKKSQNAANFLGAFIARSNYVSFDKAFSWMKKMADWCNEYINAAGLRKNVEGCLQHGTFYSVVQALLFVFSFRYKEFVENDCVKEVIQNWGLQRIIHSQFQPLRFISRIIALGFTTISRQLQIVYCFHILDDEPGKSPIEHYLPFSILQLPISSSILVPLIRKFQPADDDVDKISIDFNEDIKKRQDSSGDGDYDFMDDDDMEIEQTNVNNILSTSPISAFAATVTKAKYYTH